MNRITGRLIYSICLAAAVLSMNFTHLRMDSDILWSMAIGKWITLNNAIPVVDSFSWTIIGKEWITHEWLFSWLAYKAYTMFGSPGLFVLTAIPMILTIYVLYNICEKYDLNKSYTFLLVLIFGINFLYTLSAPFRAYVYGLLFFTLLIYWLYFKEKQRYDWLRYASLFLIWANFHASVCMGVIILLAEMLRRLIIYRDWQTMWTLLTSSLATLINPYGYRIWSYFIFTFNGMAEARSIEEWQAPDFNNAKILVFYLILASSVVIFQMILLKHSHDTDRNIKTDNQSTSTNRFARACLSLYGMVRERCTVQTCLSVLFWGFYIYSLYSARMIFYAIIMWIIVAAYYIGRISRLNFTSRSQYIFIALFGLVFAYNMITSDLNFADVMLSNHDITPVEEVDFLKENPAFQDRLFNDYIFGGYLILNDIPVFIDARSDSYIKFGIQQKYCSIIYLQQDPQEILDELGVKNILIFNDTPFARYLMVNQAWKLVYKGPTACIFTVSPDIIKK